MEHIPRLSEVMNVGLCRKIGAPTEVAIRRDVIDVWEMIMKPVTLRKGFVRMLSGSFREGFRLSSSDRDTMFWLSNYKLITDISQSQAYNTLKHDIILMEDSDTPPGFVKLRPLTSNRYRITISCLIPFNGRPYISSSLWREKYFQFLSNDKCFQQRNIKVHGPCCNAFFQGSTEIDDALCFATLFWPKLLRDWVDRCRRHKWPPVPVLENILRKGCHCVPIESKIVSLCNDLEWRLSFSQAEQQLVCTMNHTQFLCYGLLKIFLKEVINYRKEPLLCSYFMKTTMFWIIQLGHIIWCPNNLLDCFWKCFKYLIHCVYRGVFPNFFISLNNLFINKVVGDARASLLQQLFQYYRMGVSCLLLSPTLRSILDPALSSPSFVFCAAKVDCKAMADKDRCGMVEIFQTWFPAEDTSDSYLYLKSNDILSRLSLSSYQSLTLQYCTAKTLVHLAFTLSAKITLCFTHRNLYILDKMICKMLKLSGRLGPVSYLLYLALYYYRTGRYDNALYITYLTKQRLLQDFNIYMFNDNVDRQKYNEMVGYLSLSNRLKKAWVDYIVLLNNIPYIEEIRLEQNISQQNGNVLLHLSPFLMVEMLSVLSHYRLGNRSQCLQSLTDLQTLLLYDDDMYVPLETRDISWHILGICQHLVGDLHWALRSYQESLRQEAYHGIQEATDIRIGCVKQHLYRNTQA